MKLKDKVIIITGASRGLGASMARVCAAEGARVVCAAPDEPDLARVADGILEKGGTALRVPCDVTRMDDLRRLVDETVSTYGAIHGLINNAGVNFVKPFIDVTEEDWNHVLDVDLRGAFFLTQFCARQMLRQDPVGGSIVQIASVHTQGSLAGAAPYDAAKHGVVGFSKAVAVELARHNIRVNILSPGLCRTDIWKTIMAAAPSEQQCTDYWFSNIPGQRVIEPEEIAACCVFLLSDASSPINGSNILADLGMSSLLISAEPYKSRNIA